MSVLPRISGREVQKALRKIGYKFDTQHGSHMILRKIIRDVGITVEQFHELL